MTYLTIIVVTMMLTAILSFIIVSKIFKIRLNPVSLIFCVAGALVVSYIFPLLTITYLGVYKTLGVTLLLSLLIAFLIAKYEAIKAVITQSDDFTEPEASLSSTEEKLTASPDLYTSLLLPQIQSDNTLNLKSVLLAIYRKKNEPVKLEGNIQLSSREVDTSSLISVADNSDITIDKIIDKAFTLKSQQKYAQALKLFQLVFKLAPNTHHAPVVLIEIANILRNFGDYDKAVRIFEQGLMHPIIKGDPKLVHEFAIMAEYLKVVKGVLAERRLGNIEFNKIPPEIIKHIETEFREHRKGSS